MVLRRNVIRLSVIVLLIMVVPQTVVARWHGGYQVSLDGYVVPALAYDEYISFHGTYLPFDLAAGPAVHLGVTFPTVRTAVHKPLLSIGAGSSLFLIQDHPFDRMFRRDSALAPRIDTYLTFDLGSSAALTTAVFVAQPLTLYFGDKVISVLGVQLLRDFTHDSWGWGIRLFEITHYLW